MRMGVNSAIYYFEVLDALNRGMGSISLGGTSPVLTDGFSKFNLSLGAKAEELKYINHINRGNISGTKIYCYGNTEKINKQVEEEGYKDFKVLDFKIQF